MVAKACNFGLSRGGRKKKEHTRARIILCLVPCREWKQAAMHRASESTGPLDRREFRLKRESTGATRHRLGAWRCLISGSFSYNGTSCVFIPVFVELSFDKIGIHIGLIYIYKKKKLYKWDYRTTGIWYVVDVCRDTVTVLWRRYSR